MPATHERWIDDYRSVGLVDWPDGLRENLLDRRRSALRQMHWCMLPPPVFLVIAFSVSIVGHDYLPDILASGLAFVLWSVMILWTSIGVVLLAGTMKQRRQINRSLRMDQLERFELSQHVLDESHTAEALGYDTSAGLIARVRYVDPIHATLLQTDTYAADAIGPVKVYACAVPFEMAGLDHESTRKLTEHERKELSRIINKWSAQILLGSAAYLAWMSFVCFAVFLAITQRPVSWLSVPLAVLCLVISVPMTAANLYGLLDWRRASRLLRRDAIEGVAEVMSGHEAVAQFVAEDSDRPDWEIPRVTPRTIHRLPNSRQWWVVDGVPAPWRRERFQYGAHGLTGCFEEPSEDGP